MERSWMGNRSGEYPSGTAPALPLAARLWFSAGTVPTDERQEASSHLPSSRSARRTAWAVGDLRTRNPMNQLTLDLIKLAFLAVLWLFVIAAVGVVRTDLFDQPTSARSQRRLARQQARRMRATGPIPPARPARGGGRSAPRTLVVTGGSL